MVAISGIVQIRTEESGRYHTQWPWELEFLCPKPIAHPGLPPQPSFVGSPHFPGPQALSPNPACHAWSPAPEEALSHCLSSSLMHFPVLISTWLTSCSAVPLFMAGNICMKRALPECLQLSCTPSPGPLPAVYDCLLWKRLVLWPRREQVQRTERANEFMRVPEPASHSDPEERGVECGLEQPREGVGHNKMWLVFRDL